MLWAYDNVCYESSISISPKIRFHWESACFLFFLTLIEHFCRCSRSYWQYNSWCWANQKQKTEQRRHLIQQEDSVEMCVGCAVLAKQTLGLSEPRALRPPSPQPLIKSLDTLSAASYEVWVADILHCNARNTAVTSFHPHSCLCRSVQSCTLVLIQAFMTFCW